MVNKVGVVSHHIGFLDHFSKLEDPRQINKALYPLPEILLLVLCAVLSGADDWVAIALYGEKKLSFLQRFMPYKNGTPSHDQLGYLFARIDEKRFQQCFINWVTCLRQALNGVVAIDGKTLRRSFDEAGKKGAIHMVSAWCSTQNLVLGQVKVEEKSNEITAIPELLALLQIHGAIITIDAMGCQRNIAQLIIDKKADYIFSLKGNQGTLHTDVELFFKEQTERNSADTTMRCHQTVEKSHGRIEVRKVTVCTDTEWLQQRHDWAGLASIIMVEYDTEEGDKTRREVRFLISSLRVEAELIASYIRDHWSVENGLHWVMDMVFRDDECRIRKDSAPANFAVIKHMASNILRAAKGKQSMRQKRHAAAWDDAFLCDLITAT
jgi:predicted transposase YbfD/YdcC